MGIIAKSSVVWNGVCAETLEAIAVAERVYGEHGLDCVITSLNDSKHKVGSLHYKGLAVDLRLPTHVGYGLDIVKAAPMVTEIFEKLKAVLFPDYDVILEKDHYHVEYDPKTEKAVRVS